MSFQVKAFQNVQGCAEVIIRNDTEQAVALRPWEVSLHDVGRRPAHRPKHHHGGFPRR